MSKPKVHTARTETELLAAWDATPDGECMPLSWQEGIILHAALYRRREELAAPYGTQGDEWAKVRPVGNPRMRSRDHDPSRYESAVAAAATRPRDAQDLVTVPADLQTCPWCRGELATVGPIRGCLCGFVALVDD